MAEMNFGRQLLPVRVEISGGEAEDRAHWAGAIARWLNHQPCAANRHREVAKEVVMIYPDANND